MKQELTKKEIEDILNEFYNSFEYGYDFEQLLKRFQVIIILTVFYSIKMKRY